MAIKIITEPDVYLTQDEYNKLLMEYQQSFMYYSGRPPSFESWVRSKKEETDRGYRH